MAIQEKTLGQTQPTTTFAASLYSPGASTTAIIRRILVCNTTAAANTFSIYLDDDGSTYNDTTALYRDTAITANSTTEIKTFIAMDDSSGNLAVQASANSTVTFTAFGGEIT